MKAIIEVKVGEDLVATIYVPQSVTYSAWLAVAENDREIVDVSNLIPLPKVGSKWADGKFDTPSTGAPIPGYVHLAFVVNGECVMVQAFDPTESANMIAAMRSNPTFEVTYGQPV